LPLKLEKTDEKISSRMANILSWIAAALLGAASAAVPALLVWNGFLYLEYLRQPPLARPFSHGSFAPVGDPQFAENAAVSFGSSSASAARCGRIEGSTFSHSGQNCHPPELSIGVVPQACSGPHMPH
jgi:hypothetical protein